MDEDKARKQREKAGEERDDAAWAAAHAAAVTGAVAGACVKPNGKGEMIGRGKYARSPEDDFALFYMCACAARVVRGQWSAHRWHRTLRAGAGGGC